MMRVKDALMTACKICGNVKGNKIYVVREMMFETGEKFEYVECSACHCLQIKGIPDDLSKYYPGNYCSFQAKGYKKQNFLKTFHRRQKMKFWLYGKNIMGRMLTLKKSKVPPHFVGWFKKAGVRIDSKILDIGCGTGHLLKDMYNYGFSDLTGADPFIKADIIYGKKFKIFKKELFEIDNQFDFIMLHHSFEHMPDPLGTLKILYKLLKRDGCVLIRIPVAGSFAWRKYGVNWGSIDPPRHLFLHTPRSIQLLSGRAGFKVADIVFDSSELQLWGREECLRGIPRSNIKSYNNNPKNSIFSEEQITAFREKAIELNKQMDGDEAAFYLYKT